MYKSLVYKMSSGCTCGPHPCLDLTAAYLQYHKIHQNDTSSEEHQNDTSSEDELTSCHEQIRQACRSHGCFHISINLTKEDEIDSPMKCLAKPMEEVENEIESLFSPSFLDNTDADLNGGLVTARIKDLPSLMTKPFGVVEVCVKDLPNVVPSPFVENATFRGRTAESGDEQQSKPEPKLSWEFRRCLSARTELKEDESNHDPPSTQPSELHPPLDSSHAENDAWDYLPNWTKALHSVASVVIHSIGISQQVVLNETNCGCLRKIVSNKKNYTNLSTEKCNVDLLRCFRYDAISTEEIDQLGSSSHTDWGSLTVVWQDDKGGLQTYCHACEKWTDVAAPERKSASNTIINLFVHVGDFLSLATHGEGMAHLPIWPSPRHRVICPTKQPNKSESSQCRRSLVYFAYPPPNISLAAAQKVVEPLICAESCESTVMFQDYSLLHDQSQQQADQLIGGSSTNFETYEKMRRRPFGEVIQEKWEQVQRN